MSKYFGIFWQRLPVSRFLVLFLTSTPEQSSVAFYWTRYFCLFFFPFLTCIHLKIIFWLKDKWRTDLAARIYIFITYFDLYFHSKYKLNPVFSNLWPSRWTSNISLGAALEDSMTASGSSHYETKKFLQNWLCLKGKNKWNCGGPWSLIGELWGPFLSQRIGRGSRTIFFQNLAACYTSKTPVLGLKSSLAKISKPIVLSFPKGEPIFSQKNNSKFLRCYPQIFSLVIVLKHLSDMLHNV